MSVRPPHVKLSCRTHRISRVDCDFLSILDRDHFRVPLNLLDHNRANVRHWAEANYYHPTAGQYVNKLHLIGMIRALNGWGRRAAIALALRTKTQLSSAPTLLPRHYVKFKFVLWVGPVA
ncbi:hypothetical protein CCR75_004286 [Bremia lactucae]|uniref:Uncharacterized protein n=1 Tax=Bremia lactucae TaxID=4779 RepID=A0A976II45_BRELC|nr:hypothetical protein CCR75_004286 [Bremia lactucae]